MPRRSHEHHPWAAGWPDGFAWCIGRLAAIGGSHDQVLGHAQRLWLRVLALHWRKEASGYELVGTKLVPRPTRGGLEDLRRLRAAARRSVVTGDLDVYAAAYAGASHKVWGLVGGVHVPPLVRPYQDNTGQWRIRPPIRDVIRIEMVRQSAPPWNPHTIRQALFATLAPAPAVAIPLIERALIAWELISPKQRQRRVADQLVDDFAGVINAAYADLAGKLSSNPVWRGGDRLDSPVLTLARDVDHHFGLNVFDARDSRRLRRLFSKKLSAS